MLLHNNTQPHATVHCQTTNIKSEALQYPLHNHVLAPSALNLFGLLEEALQGPMMMK
jgi:hypothetical protein